MNLVAYFEAWKRLPLLLVVGMVASYLIAIEVAFAHAWISPFLASLCWVMLLLRLSLPKDTTIILTIGMFFYWWWLVHSDFRFCTADLDGHLAYMDYIAKHFSLPLPHTGWEFYHPPLYYIITGFIEIISQALHWPFMEMLRLFSLMCFLAFLFYAHLTLTLTHLPRYLYRLCLLLMVLWPSGVVIATRINSDLLVYPFCMASFYHLLYWHQSASIRELKRSLIHLALAIATRSNAIVVVATIILTIGYNLFIRRRSFGSVWNRQLASSLILVLLALGVNSGRNVYERVAYNINEPLMIGNAHIVVNARQLVVPNAAENLFTFDFTHYVTPPFTTIFNDGGGRQNFWTAFFKSMLWCLCEYKQIELAMVANVCLLGLLATIIIPAVFYRKRELDERLPHLLLFFISVGALWVNRFNIPIASSGEWRYCYFAIVPAIILWGYNVNDFKNANKNKLYVLAIAIALALCGFGDAVYLGQFTQ